MSTLAEIQEAVANLPADEKRALSIWLDSQTELEMDEAEEAALLKSLDRAAADLSAGKGVPIEEVRNKVKTWAGR